MLYCVNYVFVCYKKGAVSNFFLSIRTFLNKRLSLGDLFAEVSLDLMHLPNAMYAISLMKVLALGALSE